MTTSLARLVLLLAALFGSTFLSACNTCLTGDDAECHDSTDHATPDLATPDLTTPDLAKAGDAAVADLSESGVCSALPLGTAPTVFLAQTSDPLPTATGGTIADGLYYLTSITFRDAVDAGSGLSTRQAFQFTGAGFEGAIDLLGNTSTGAGSVVKAGTRLSLDYTCPTSGAVSFDYSATSTSLTLILPTLGGGTVYTYTKQ